MTDGSSANLTQSDSNTSPFPVRIRRVNCDLALFTKATATPLPSIGRGERPLWERGVLPGRTLTLERRNEPPFLPVVGDGRCGVPRAEGVGGQHSVNCHNVPTRFLLRVQGQQGELHPPQSTSIRGHLRHPWVLVVLGEAGKCPRKRKRGCFPKARNC